MHPEKKPCQKCGIPQLLGAFYRDRSRPDGRRTTCIACDKARKRTPEVRAQGKKYNESEQGKAAYERYRASGRKYEVVRAYQDRPESRAMRKERGPAWTKKYEQSPKGKARYERLKADPEYREKRRRTERAYHSNPLYAERLRLQGLVKENRRRERKANLPATFTSDDWAYALNWFEQSCAYCERSGVPLCQEHAVSIVHGGPYTPSNIVPACKPCNSSKRSESWDVWATPQAKERIRSYFEQLKKELH